MYMKLTKFLFVSLSEGCQLRVIFDLLRQAEPQLDGFRSQLAAGHQRVLAAVQLLATRPGHATPLLYILYKFRHLHTLIIIVLLYKHWKFDIIWYYKMWCLLSMWLLDFFSELFRIIVFKLTANIVKCEY